MMRQLSSSVLPETEPRREQPRRSRVPVVERVAGWSTRHRKTVRQVVTALSALPHSAQDIVSPLGPSHAGLVAGDGRSALVTFHVPGNARNEDQAVAPALRAVARVQAAHPGLRVQEAGDASTDRAANALISRQGGSGRSGPHPVDHPGGRIMSRALNPARPAPAARPAAAARPAPIGGPEQDPGYLPG